MTKYPTAAERSPPPHRSRPGKTGAFPEASWVAAHDSTRTGAAAGSPPASTYDDPGGADAFDLESGVDFAVGSQAADPALLYVYGVSYGGYISAWLLPRSRRFVAGMACGPVTHWVSQRFTCRTLSWCGRLVGDELPRDGGLRFSRSPLHAAASVDAPLLLVCGALDRNTPPTQALEMSQAPRVLDWLMGSRRDPDLARAP